MEYLDALQWYLKQGGANLANRFEAEFQRTVSHLAERPEAWPSLSKDKALRWIRLRRFPYVVFFEIIRPVSLRVLAIAHERRRPMYWAERRND